MARPAGPPPGIQTSQPLERQLLEQSLQNLRLKPSRRRLNKEDFKQLVAEQKVPLFGSSVDTAFLQFQAILKQNSHLQTRPENLVNILVDTLKRKALVNQATHSSDTNRKLPFHPHPHPHRAALLQKPLAKSTGELFKVNHKLKPTLQAQSSLRRLQTEQRPIAYKRSDGSVVKVRRRNTINGFFKPPPPTAPPPRKTSLSQPELGEAPEARRSSVGATPSVPLPLPLPLPGKQEKKLQGAEATVGSTEVEREDNVISLQKRVRFLEKDLAARQMDFNAVKEELEAAKKEIQASKQMVESLREQVVVEKAKGTKAAEEVDTLKLEQKTTARKSRQRFDAAIDFVKAMLVDARVPGLIQVIKSRIRVIVGVERAEVYIVDEEQAELVSYREKRASSKPLPSGDNYWIGRFPVDVGIVGAVVQERQVQVVKDVEKDVRFDALVDGIGSNGVRNLIAYPLQVRQKVSRPKYFPRNGKAIHLLWSWSGDPISAINPIHFYHDIPRSRQSSWQLIS